jgi:hypothetical protein
MTTTDTPSSFADRLRALADLYDQHPDLPAPTSSQVRLYISGYTPAEKERCRDGFAAARNLTDIPPTVSEYYVEVDLGHDFRLLFNKESVGSKRTVTREVEEFVLDETPGVTSQADRDAAAAVNEKHRAASHYTGLATQAAAQ